MKTRILFLLAFVVMCCTTAMAQITVKGNIVSDKDSEPMIGVAILEQGTSNGTITDIDGNFSLTVKSNATLVVSYVGYNTQTVKVSGSGPLNIRLVEDSKLLDDVVVIGYGTQRKSDLTGSVASVKADDLKNRSTSDAGAALQGKVSGVQIVNGGSPGQAADIRVRGYSSNSGNIGPLLIVDGLRVDNISYLDPSMIASMEVLKDAASAAIYGAQAGNGVILITTKTGAAGGGKAKISYEGKFTLKSLGKKAELFDATKYKQYQTYIGNLTKALLESNGDYNKDDAYANITDTNWYDAAYENSWTMQHSVTVQGGNDKGHFLATLNLLNDDGIFKGDKDVYKRLTGQINADYKLFKWFDVASTTSIEKWSRRSIGNGYGSTLNSVVSIDPLTPVYISDIKNTPVGMQAQYESNPNLIPRDPSHNNDFYGTSKYLDEATGNPLFQRDKTDATSSGINVRGTFTANLRPVSGLVITSRFGYRIAQSSSHSYTAPYWLTAMAQSTNYDISANVNTNHRYQWENFANYMKDFGKNNVNVMAGMSYVQTNSDNASISSNGPNILKGYEPNFRYIDYLTSDATKSVGNAPGKLAELSFFGRLMYSYDNRYSIQGNFRADAFDSSKLSKNQRWGYFPSVSAGWTLSNESFWKDNINKDVVSFVKFRGSWGRNGNVNVLSGYQYSSTITLNGEFYQYNPSTGTGNPTYGSMPSGLANPDLKWETSEQLDFGLDARFLKDRLTLGIDWYQKYTKDLLVQVTPVPEVGVSSSWVNAGKVLNRGWEFELGWKDQVGDFRYSISANASTLKNEVQEVHSTVNRIENDPVSGLNEKMTMAFEAGYPIWYFRGYKYAGVDQTTGQALYYTLDGKTTTAPGENDKFYLGEGIPNFTYGITINLAWKGLDFTLFGTGAAGNEIYNLMVSADRSKTNGITTFWDNSYKVISADMKEKNPYMANLQDVTANAMYPDMKATATSWEFFSSSAAVFNGSYFKFKQIQLGYTIPSKWTKKALISDLRVYVSLDDFFTITSYPGADPETASLNATTSRGVDSGSYPTSKKAVFGINLTF